jgi:hypothetical protein
MKVVRLSALRIGHLYTLTFSADINGIHFC